MSIIQRRPQHQVQHPPEDGEIYTLSVRSVMCPLIATVAVLTAAGAASMFLKLMLGSSIYGTVLHGILHLFDLGLEGNIPTWYASASLLLCAVLLFLIGRTTSSSGTGSNWQWYGLSGVFVLASIDETSSIHEGSGDALNQLVPAAQDLGGIFFYSWVFVGIVVVLLLALIFGHFIFSLPRRTRTFFILAAVTFVGGALGVEMLNAWIHNTRGTETFGYVSMTVLEEMLEMVGVLIFAYGLLDVLRGHRKEVRLRWTG